MTFFIRQLVFATQEDLDNNLAAIEAWEEVAIDGVTEPKSEDSFSSRTWEANRLCNHECNRRDC